jgi:hypothetical protein
MRLTCFCRVWSSVCVVRRGHPAAEAPLDLPAFLALSHLLVSPENERFGQVDAALAKRGLKRRLAPPSRRCMPRRR